MIDIVFIINSFNRLFLLREAIESIVGWLQPSEFAGRIALLIFEAGSSDGSVEYLKKLEHDGLVPLKVIWPQPSEPNNFAHGINEATRLAETIYIETKFFVFYETDNVFLSAEPLKKAIILLEKHSELGVCGFTVKKHDGNPAGAGMPFPRLWHFILGPELAHKLKLDANRFVWKRSQDILWSYCDVVFTSPCVVKRAAWLASGGFDESNFPFSDCDVDWARSLRKLEWRMAVVNSPDAIHDNRAALSKWSITRARNLHRARFRYFRKHLGNWVSIIIPLLMLRHSAELLFLIFSWKPNANTGQRVKNRFSLLASAPFQYE